MTQSIGRFLYERWQSYMSDEGVNTLNWDNMGDHCRESWEKLALELQDVGLIRERA